MFAKALPEQLSFLSWCLFSQILHSDLSFTLHEILTLSSY